MAQRISVWVSAGLLAAAMSAATVAGWALAVADDGPDGTSTQTSSESTDPGQGESPSGDDERAVAELDVPDEPPDTEDEQPATDDADGDTDSRDVDDEGDVEIDEPRTAAGDTQGDSDRADDGLIPREESITVTQMVDPIDVEAESEAPPEQPVGSVVAIEEPEPQSGTVAVTTVLASESAAPESAEREVIPDTADFIAHHITLSGAENVSIYADSAGVSHAMSGVRELLLSGRPVRARMVPLSGVLDSSLTNPGIRDVDDPMFDVDDLAVWDSHWCDGIDDRQDPLVSPLFFTDQVLHRLPPTTIYVGEREILCPDTLLMHERAVALGAPVSVVVGTGRLHGWPISGLPLYTQTAALRPDIYRQLGLTDGESL